MIFWNIGEVVIKAETLARDLKGLETGYKWLCDREELRNQSDSLAVGHLREVVGAVGDETLTEAVERLTAERDQYKNELKEIRERLNAALGGAT